MTLLEKATGIGDLNVFKFKVFFYFLDSSKFSLNDTVFCHKNVCFLLLSIRMVLFGYRVQSFYSMQYMQMDKYWD